MWSGHLKAALASLRSSRGRSFLTMLGIVIGITLVVTIVSLGEGLKHKIVGQVNHLGGNVITVRPGKLVSSSNGSESLNPLALLSTSTLSTQDVSSLTKLSSVGAVAPIDFVSSSVSSDNQALDNVAVLATSAALPEILHTSLDSGNFFGDKDEGQNFAVIGATIARQLYGDVNPLGYTIKILEQDFIIHGVLAKSSTGLPSLAQADFDSAVFVPFSSGKALVGDKDNILQILAVARDGGNPSAAVAEVRATVLKNHAGQEDFSVLKQTELLNLASGVVSSATRFVSAIAAVALLVGGIGIMDIMLASVSERTREIGIRKALGATNRQILSQFLVEGLALSVGGGLIGVVVALLINLGLKLYTGLDPVVSIPVVLLAVGVSIAVGIIFSVAPALKAARKDPITALRGE
ncbi:ABC transporter permease [Candidatus Saccharibacteria bacterium]|nr:ABC transporter permease [Candidatus Saccharibacteria bacterium]